MALVHPLMPTEQQEQPLSPKKQPVFSDDDDDDAAVEELQVEEEDYVVEMERLAAQNLTEEKLWRIARTRKLHKVREIELMLKSSCMFFANVGELLPNLLELCLDGSEISTLRDLGTSLASLKVLSIRRCGLTELDGLAAFPQLSTLNVTQNKISDLDALFHHDCLQVLDARSNKIDSLMALEVLGTCSLLYSAQLKGNPLQRRLPEELYARVVCLHVPSLRALDGKHVHFVDPLDETDLTKATEALANENDEEQEDEEEQPVVTKKVDDAPWRAVLGSKKQAPLSPSSSDHRGMLSDPSASALTLDGNVAFAGSAAALRRLRQRPLPLPQSVVSTLDEAMRFEESLRATSPQAKARPAALKLWEDEAAALRREGDEADLLYNKRPVSSSSSSSSSRPRTAPQPTREQEEEEPTTSPNSRRRRALLPVPAALEAASRTSSSSSSLLPAASRPASASSMADSLRSDYHEQDCLLPAPLMLSEADRRRAAASHLARPQSRRSSRRLAFEEQEEEEQHKRAPAPETPAAATTASSGWCGPADAAAAALSEDSDDDLVMTRAAIKSQASAQKRPKPTTRQQRRGSTNADVLPPTEAARLIGFDLEGSLAALTQWSEAAEADDDGAVRFDRRGSTAAPPLDDDNDDSEQPAPVAPCSLPAKAKRGPLAVDLDDETLVAMLKQPPKTVRHLRTRDGFKTFFNGLSKTRMRSLLEAAFQDQTPEESKRRLAKRLDLLQEVLVEP